MQRIAFIDYAYHQTTRSAEFFVDLLRDRFDVTVYYDGIQSQSFVNDVMLAKFDIIVLWQTEYLAPYFIAAGKRVVCIPMYDGAGAAPNHYWHHMRQARHINFSHRLHNHVCGLGLTSLPVQYMMNPADVTPVSDYSSARVVFWQRRPEHGLTAARIRRIVGPEASLHVHNAPDIASPEQFPAHGANTVSHFDLDRNPLADAMNEANVFVCPRMTEGIGMAMIEAMARGLRANGVEVEDGPDWWIVRGRGAGLVPGGATVETFLDHRIAMSFLCLGMAAQAPVALDDGAPVATSFPIFEPLMAGLGADIRRQG